MKTKIIDNWEVELTNDKGDTLTLKGEWYVDFFKEYENKQLTIQSDVQRSEQLFCPDCGAKNWDRENGNKHCLDCDTCW